MRKIIGDLNEKLIVVALNNENIPVGLFSGKMGLCIYFFQLSRSENNKEYNTIAEKLLDEVFSQTCNMDAIDIENGLLGISFGINYLLKNNYVQGNENEILKDVDDKIFRYISFHQPHADISILIQALYYIYIRKQSSLSKEANYLFDELSIYIINFLHSRIESVVGEKVISFKIETKLPQFLFVLSKIWKLNIYNYKIIKIIEEIIPFILSKYEYLDSQRLYLLWGVSKINSCIKDKRLTEYCNLLVSHINLDRLINEFRNKNVFINNGISGICLLTASLEESEKQKLDLKGFRLACKKKIENSLIWELYINNEYLKNYIGITGYCGVAIVWNMLRDQYER